jgi:GAF domain-containing protein
MVSRRAYLAQQKALAQTEALYLASRKINEANSLQEVVAAVAGMNIIPIINRIVLFGFEEDADGSIEAMQVIANWHNGQGYPPSPIGRRYAQTEFSTVRLMISSEPLFFEDAQSDPRMDAPIRAVAQQQDIRAMVVLPLRTGGRQLGVLLLQAEEVHKFGEQDIQAYLSLAPQVAAAVDNQRLLDETRTALAEVEAIQRRYTVQSWEAYQARTPVRGYEQIEDQLIALGDEPLPVDVSEAVIQKQTVLMNLPVLTDGTSETQAESHLPALSASSNLIVPLTVRDQVVGVLGLQEMETGRSWAPEEIALVEAIAEQLALAAESIRLLDETQQRAARERRVNEIGEKIQAAQSLEEALQIAVKEVGLSLQAPQTVVKLEIE